MSHHYSGPDFSFPQGDARLDFTDLYAFPRPGDAGKSILIMNVHPSAGENPDGPTTTEPFAPDALYELKIDTDGDSVADIAYRVRFSSFESGAQTATVRRIDGSQAAGTGDGGQVIVDGAPVSTGREARITKAGNTSFFAGWRSDPFFCDVEGAKNNLQFTGDDFFADKDVCSIVLEVPNSALGAKEVRLWARTLTLAAGSRSSAEPGLRKQSYLSKREMPTSRVNPRAMSVSLLASRTLWSTRVDIRRLRRRAWLGHCSRMFCLMTLRYRRLFPTTAEDSLMMRSILLFASSPMEGDGRQSRGAQRSIARLSLRGITSSKPRDESVPEDDRNAKSKMKTGGQQT